MQTLTRTPTDPPQARRHWLRAAAVVAVIAGAVAVLVAVQRDDESPATNPTPQTTTNPTVATTEPTLSRDGPAEHGAGHDDGHGASRDDHRRRRSSTFVGSTLDTFPVDLASNPYFVGAADEVWVSSLGGRARATRRSDRRDRRAGDDPRVVAVRSGRQRRVGRRCHRWRRHPARSRRRGTRSLGSRPASRSCPTASVNRCSWEPHDRSRRSAASCRTATLSGSATRRAR